MVRGENDHAEHSAAGLGDALLAFFDKLLRGLPEDRVRVFVADVLREAREQADAELVKNLFVLAFQTRWCRGGKGERQVVLVLLKILFERFPAVVFGASPPDWPRGQSGYLMLIPSEKRFTTAVHAVFDENLPGSPVLTTNPRSFCFIAITSQ